VGVARQCRATPVESTSLQACDAQEQNTGPGDAGLHEAPATRTAVLLAHKVIPGQRALLGAGTARGNRGLLAALHALHRSSTPYGGFSGPVGILP
jgi:hypothetical protein